MNRVSTRISTAALWGRTIVHASGAVKVAVLFWLAVAAAWGQCQAITSSRPRLYLPNAAYGSYPTILARLQAAMNANSYEWQQFHAQATYYLNNEAGYFADSAGMEEALMYALNPTANASYGARALHYLLETVGSPAVITAATNANPTVFTTATPHGLSTGNTAAAVWGGTGKWAAFNQASIVSITVIDSTHFSIPIDSTSFGPLTGNMTAGINNFTDLNNARWNTPQVAEMWDWVHPLLASGLTSAQTTAIENVMVAAITFVANNPFEWTSLTSPNPVGGIGNLNIGPLAGALEMAVAFSGDVPGMQAVCSQLRSNFLTLAPIYTVGTAGSGYQIFPLAHGGALVEAVGYGQEVAHYLQRYLQVMLGSTGENLYSQVAGWQTAALQFLFNDASPGTASSGGSYSELFTYGDESPGASLTGVTREVVEHLAYYLCSIGDSTNCAYAEWWLQNVFTEAQATTQGNTTESPELLIPNEFLWYDPTLPARDPRNTYGTDLLADGYSILLSRSAWASTATWVQFKGGALRKNDEDHWHADILTFGMYRNGDWLTHELVGYNVAVSTQFHNAPLPATNQTGLNGGSNPPSYPDSIGGMPSYGRVTQYESNPNLNYVFAQADASIVYRGSSNPYTIPPYIPSINTVLRDFLYLKPDIVVIQDRLAYSAPTTAKWDIQALADPGSPTGNSFTLPSLLGSNALNVSVVSPASPIYNVVSSSAQIAEANALGPSPCGCANQWRVELTSGNSTTSEQYMAVLQAGDSGFTPLAVSTLTSANLNSAQFGGYVVSALTDTTQTGVVRSYTFIPAKLTHLVMGLKPSTAYSVVRTSNAVVISDGTGGANDITAGPGGALEFSTGGSLSACDLNGDGVVNSADVQIAIAQSLGTSPCTSAALAQSGTCNVIDVQRVINAANGQACKVGP